MFLTRLFLVLLGVLPTAMAVVEAPAQQAAVQGAGEGDIVGAGTGPDSLADVTAHGDLVLASGTVLGLGGIRFPDDGAWRERAIARLRSFRGQAIDAAGRGRPDRWGRVVARLLAGAEPGRVDLAQDLVGDGLALVDPGAGDGSLATDLLSHEDKARNRGLGLWGDARYKAISVRQTERLRDRIGHFVVVEGRVRTVGEREQRTYLNFGADWASDFTIIIAKRTWSAFLKRGTDAASLKGRRIRARGVLDDWQGPALTVALPDALEVLDDEPERRP